MNPPIPSIAATSGPAIFSARRSTLHVLALTSFVTLPRDPLAAGDGPFGERRQELERLFLATCLPTAVFAPSSDGRACRRSNDVDRDSDTYAAADAHALVPRSHVRPSPALTGRRRLRPDEHVTENTSLNIECPTLRGAAAPRTPSRACR